MRTLVLTVCLTLLASVPCLPAAQADRSLTRKTIEIQATAKVEVPAEVAIVKIGYTNKAASRQAIYAENVRMSKKIGQALTDEHVAPSAIETQAVTLEREEEREGTAPPKVLKFSADQEWRVRVPARDAQKIVDIAVGTGATNVAGIDWDVKEPQALETRAYAAAIERAKKIAERTATQSGVKLGEMVSVTNFFNRFGGGGGLSTESTTLSEVASKYVATVPLTLYPPKIERQATVTVTYAIAQ
jgi:uncharacterized protein